MIHRSGPVLFGKPLTLRELEICALVAAGEANKTIAFKVGLTPGTVKVYCTHIFKKLGLENRTALAVWWVNRSAVQFAEKQKASRESAEGVSDATHA